MCQEQCRENLFENHEVGRYEMNRNHRETIRETKKGKAFNNSQVMVGCASGEWGRMVFTMKKIKSTPKMQARDIGKSERKDSL